MVAAAFVSLQLSDRSAIYQVGRIDLYKHLEQYLTYVKHCVDVSCMRRKGMLP